MTIAVDLGRRATKQTKAMRLYWYTCAMFQDDRGIMFSFVAYIFVKLYHM